MPEPFDNQNSFSNIWEIFQEACSLAHMAQNIVSLSQKNPFTNTYEEISLASQSIHNGSEISSSYTNSSVHHFYYNEAIKMFEKCIVKCNHILTQLSGLNDNSNNQEDDDNTSFNIEFYPKLISLLSCANNNLGNCFYYKQDYDSSLKYHKQDLELTRLNCDIWGQCVSHSNIYHCYVSLMFLATCPTTHSQSDKNNDNNAKTTLILSYITNAINALLAHIELARELGKRDVELTGLKNLINLYSLQDDFGATKTIGNKEILFSNNNQHHLKLNESSQHIEESCHIPLKMKNHITLLPDFDFNNTIMLNTSGNNNMASSDNFNRAKKTAVEKNLGTPKRESNANANGEEADGRSLTKIGTLMMALNDTQQKIMVTPTSDDLVIEKQAKNDESIRIEKALSSPFMHTISTPIITFVNQSSRGKTQTQQVVRRRYYSMEHMEPHDTTCQAYRFHGNHGLADQSADFDGGRQKHECLADRTNRVNPCCTLITSKQQSFKNQTPTSMISSHSLKDFSNFSTSNMVKCDNFDMTTPKFKTLPMKNIIKQPNIGDINFTATKANKAKFNYENSSIATFKDETCVDETCERRNAIKNATVNHIETGQVRGTEPIFVYPHKGQPIPSSYDLVHTNNPNTIPDNKNILPKKAQKAHKSPDMPNIVVSMEAKTFMDETSQLFEQIYAAQNARMNDQRVEFYPKLQATPSVPVQIRQKSNSDFDKVHMKDMNWLKRSFMLKHKTKHVHKQQQNKNNSSSNNGHSAKMSVKNGLVNDPTLDHHYISSPLSTTLSNKSKVISQTTPRPASLIGDKSLTLSMTNNDNFNNFNGDDDVNDLSGFDKTNTTVTSINSKGSQVTAAKSLSRRMSLYNQFTTKVFGKQKLVSLAQNPEEQEINRDNNFLNREMNMNKKNGFQNYFDQNNYEINNDRGDDKVIHTDNIIPAKQNFPHSNGTHTKHSSSPRNE